MAKTFLNVFRDSAETLYATGRNPIITNAMNNKGVNFLATPIQGSNGQLTANTVKTVQIQRLKRIKAKDLVASTGKHATDSIAMLDQASKLDWDTIETKPITPRVIQIVQPSQNSANDVLENADPYAKEISTFMDNQMLEQEEQATFNLAKSASKQVTLDLSATITKDKALEISQKLKTQISNVRRFVDDFKAGSNSVVAIVCDELDEVLNTASGTNYYASSDTIENLNIPNGARNLGNAMVYTSTFLYTVNSDDVYGTTFPTGVVTGDRLLGLIYDTESYANAGIGYLNESFDTIIGIKRFTGIVYGQLDAVIDPKRIIAIWGKLPTESVAQEKVNKDGNTQQLQQNEQKVNQATGQQTTK